MNRSASIEVVHAGADHWPDIERLFGRAGGSNGCWCQYWLLGADYKRRDRSLNQRDLETQVRDGDAGLVAYRGEVAVGWARFTPRTELDWLLNRFGRYDFGPEDAWSVSCFFIARQARGQGVMSRLIEFAARWGREHNTVIQGYPVDTALAGATRNVFPGTLHAFSSAGFVEQGRLGRDRAVVVCGAAPGSVS